MDAREAAALTGMTEGAIRVAMFRLRLRFRELLIEEVAPTVSADGEIEQEIRALPEAF